MQCSTLQGHQEGFWAVLVQKSPTYSACVEMWNRLDINIFHKEVCLTHLNSPGLIRENMERAPRQLPGRLHFQNAAARNQTFFGDPLYDANVNVFCRTHFTMPMYLRSTGWQYPAQRYSGCPKVCSGCGNMVRISTRGREEAHLFET